MMVFCNFLEIKAEIKKVVGVKVVSFGVLYSCVKFRRLKMGDPVYRYCEESPDSVNMANLSPLEKCVNTEGKIM